MQRVKPQHCLPSAIVDFVQPHSLRLSFLRPRAVWGAHDWPSLKALLERVQEEARQGAWCVGGLRYEAARCFGLPVVDDADKNLAWFAIYDTAHSQGGQDIPTTENWNSTLDWDREQIASSQAFTKFEKNIERIHEDISAGRYYQLNLTQQCRGRKKITTPQESQDSQENLALFQALQIAQPGGYSLYLNLEYGNHHETILSVSPELFFDWHQEANGCSRILTRPMKGTAPRGNTPEHDRAQAEALRSSIKERAENVMIVDLLRNDLGRIAEVGSVHTRDLFALRALPSVWQMTSDVEAQLPADCGLVEIFQALFPCGSVTGAPKRASMSAITDIEQQPRGWYCGALGVVCSDGAGGVRATFNVPIRTLVVNGQRGQSEQSISCGIGSAITADARAKSEWEEWRVKRAFFERVSMPFEILETFALEDGQARHAQMHQERMAAAAKHFSYPWNAAAFEAELQRLAAEHPRGLWRCRLLLDAQGRMSAEAFACPASPDEVALALADTPLVEAGSEFVRFKTTRRQHYERHYELHSNDAVFDVLLHNSAGEITECTRGNIAAFLDGRWITPPVRCGLLAGVGRRVALEQGKIQEEAVLRLADVPHVEKWAFLNSLRGWIEARVVC